MVSISRLFTIPNFFKVKENIIGNKQVFKKTSNKTRFLIASGTRKTDQAPPKRIYKKE
jgi:hypothetical protein